MTDMRTNGESKAFSTLNDDHEFHHTHEMKNAMISVLEPTLLFAGINHRSRSLRPRFTSVSVPVPLGLTDASASKNQLAPPTSPFRPLHAG